MPVPLPLPECAISRARTKLRNRGAASPMNGHGPRSSKLDVYQVALEALDTCDRVNAQLPDGRSQLRRQIDRASCSVVANIAEGAGEFSPAEKARFYRMARRSAVEVAAWLEIARRRGEASEELVEVALGHLERVVAMLVRLIRSSSRRG